MKKVCKHCTWFAHIPPGVSASGLEGHGDCVCRCDCQHPPKNYDCRCRDPHVYHTFLVPQEYVCPHFELPDIPAGGHYGPYR